MSVGQARWKRLYNGTELQLTLYVLLWRLQLVQSVICYYEGNGKLMIPGSLSLLNDRNWKGFTAIPLSVALRHCFITFQSESIQRPSSVSDDFVTWALTCIYLFTLTLSYCCITDTELWSADGQCSSDGYVLVDVEIVGTVMFFLYPKFSTVMERLGWVCVLVQSKDTIRQLLGVFHVHTH